MNSVFSKKSRGVTLIEVSLILAILSVIFVILFISYEFFVKKVKVTKVALETKEYAKSLESFHLVYGGLPGDLASAKKRISASLIDGDGDGRIQTEEEQFQVWPHLSEAKMLEKVGGGKFQNLAINASPELGVNLPYIRNTDNLAIGVVFNTPSGYRANSFIVGGLDGRNVSRPILTQEAIAMGDNKYDDGLPTSGAWMCGTNPPGVASCNYSNAAQDGDNFMLYLPFTRTLSSSSSNSCPPQSLQIGQIVANIPEVQPSNTYTGACRDINPNYMGSYQVRCSQQSGGNYALDILSNACTLKQCNNIYSTSNIMGASSVQSGNVIAGNNLVYGCTSPNVPKVAKCVASLTDDTAYFAETPACVASSSLGTIGNIPIYQTQTDFTDSGRKFNDAGTTNSDIFSANRIFELLGKMSIDHHHVTKFNATENRLIQSLLFDNGTTVSIGTDEPKAKAMLEMQSTSQGFLPPRMTTVQRNAITDSLTTAQKTEITGLTIFNTDTGRLQSWKGDSWSSDGALESVPVGTVVAWPVENMIPNGWLLMDGQAIDSSTYPELASLFGSNLPDFRGYFLRGHGTNSDGTASGTAFRGKQAQATARPTIAFTSDSQGTHTHTATADSQGSHTHAYTMDNAGSHTHGGLTGSMNQNATHRHTLYRGSTETGGARDSGGYPSIDTSDLTTNVASDAINLTNTDHQHSISADGTHTHVLNIAAGGVHTHTITNATNGAHTHSITGGGDSETRPKNIAVHYIIKAKQVAISDATVNDIIDNLIDDNAPAIGHRVVKFNAEGGKLSSTVISEIKNSDDTVSIGVNTDTPNSHAILELQSTKGFLPPRMTTSQRNSNFTSLSTSDVGLTIYNTDTKSLQAWNGTEWSEGSALESVPVGTIVSWGSATIPNGWLLLNGQAINSSAYPELAAMFGSNLPDFRGYFLRGQGNGSGALLTTQAQATALPTTAFTSDSQGAYTPTGTIASGGAFTPTGTIASGGAHTHTGTTDNQGAHSHTYKGYNTVASGTGVTVKSRVYYSGDPSEYGGESAGAHSHNLTIYSGGAHTHTLTMDPVVGHAHTLTMNAVAAHTHSITGGGDNETRPKNIAVNYIIKAKGVAMSQSNVEAIVDNLLDNGSAHIGNRMVKFNSDGTKFESSIISESGGSIGVNNDAPSTNAILDLSSATSKGLLLPNVNTTTTLTAPASTDKGLLVYDTASDQLKFWNGTAWTSAGGTQTWSTETQGIYNDSGNIVMVRGTYGSGQTLTTTGAGARMFFYPKKAAFRAGNVSGTQWDVANIGDYSVAMGYNTTASGLHSVAMGAENLSSGDQSVATGFATTASGWYSFTMGAATTASGTSSVAMGSYSKAIGEYSTATGFATTARPYASLAIGQYNVISGTTTFWVATDPLFVAGNGTAWDATSNALTLLKNGNMTIAGTLTQNSDARLKENVEDYDFEDALEKIKQVRTVSYEWKNKKTYGNGTKYGVIAQEIKKLFPEFVEEGKASGGYMSVSYDHLTLPLINATKQLASEQDKIKARLEKLEKSSGGQNGNDAIKQEIKTLWTVIYVLIGVITLMMLIIITVLFKPKKRTTFYRSR